MNLHESLKLEKKDAEILTDQCVRCGVCMPHCPTYQLSQHEGDSPRGRIALVAGLMQQKLKPTTALKNHLDRCLTCLACEVVCPSKVAYEAIIDEGRARSLSPLKAVILRLLMLTQHIFSPLFIRTLPNPTQEGPLKKINLFTGCTMPFFDRTTIIDAISVLNTLGFYVQIPKTQACCGALPQHQGMLTTAQCFQDHNHRVFNEPYPVVSLATACTAHLKGYDILEFLLEYGDLKKWTFKPLNATVFILIPCSLRNNLKKPLSIHQLLSTIPGLTLIESKRQQCCGAAGLSMLTHPRQAQQLIAPYIEEIQKIRPDYVVTANIGCLLHLKKMIRKSNLKVNVIHPVTLLKGTLSEKLHG